MRGPLRPGLKNTEKILCHGPSGPLYSCLYLLHDLNWQILTIRQQIKYEITLLFIIYNYHLFSIIWRLFCAFFKLVIGKLDSLWVTSHVSELLCYWQQNENRKRSWTFHSVRARSSETKCKLLPDWVRQSDVIKLQQTHELESWRRVVYGLCYQGDIGLL